MKLSMCFSTMKKAKEIVLTAAHHQNDCELYKSSVWDEKIPCKTCLADLAVTFDTDENNIVISTDLLLSTIKTISHFKEHKPRCNILVEACSQDNNEYLHTIKELRTNLILSFALGNFEIL